METVLSEISKIVLIAMVTGLFILATSEPSTYGRIPLYKQGSTWIFSALGIGFYFIIR
jgi:hypothetical protein